MTKALIFAVAMFGAAPGFAADFSDPTWPCVQRKVERLSLGLMWPVLPDPDYVVPDTARDAARALAESLALRRLTVEALEPEVAAFAETHGGAPQLLAHVFAQVFERLSNRRTRIIDGIGRFSLSQIALAEKIDGMRVEMNETLAAEDPDFDRVDQLEEKLDWDQVIYTDRQQSITYLCETPVLLEKRLYGIARLLQSHMEG